MAEFSDLLEVDNSLIRKWGRHIIYVQDYSAPVPTAFFDAEGFPVIPADAFNLGFTTTDGLVLGQSVSSTDTNMSQWVSPARSDLESIVQTFAFTLGESSSAWAHALRRGIPLADWPADKKSPYSFGATTKFEDFPKVRLWAVAADGVGDQAFYRVEYAPQAKITATGDRTLARPTNETLPFTLTAYEDTAAGGDPVWTMENGPGFGVTPPPGP